MRLNSRYRQRSGVASQALPDGLVLVDLDRGTTFRLNCTGKAAWEFLGQSCTLAEIVERMRHLWNVPVDQLERDMAALVGDLISNQLLDVEAVSEPSR